MQEEQEQISGEERTEKNNSVQPSISEMTQQIDARVEKLFQDNPELQELEKTKYDPKEKVTVDGQFMNTLLAILSQKDTLKQTMNMAFATLHRQLEILEMADSSLTELALTQHVKNLKKKKFNK